MTKVILIITDEYDSHADAVLLELKRRGATVFRFHPDDVPTGYKISIEIENGILQGEISNEYRGVSLKDIQSVWYRGTRVLFPKKRGIVDRSIQEYIALQSHEIVKALYKMIDASWISHPEKLMFAEIKALQLFKAYHAGLCVPATLFSNDPMKTASFIGKLGEAACAIKPITLEGVTSKDGYRFPLTKILPDNYPLDSVVYAPSIFQPYIPKIADLRCVVIGEKIFCAKILSQANDETKLD